MQNTWTRGHKDRTRRPGAPDAHRYTMVTSWKRVTFSAVRGDPWSYRDFIVVLLLLALHMSRWTTVYVVALGPTLTA